MSDTIPSHFQSRGVFGEQRFARGDDIRINHAVELAENANRQRAALCRGWWQLVSTQRIRERDISSGVYTYTDPKGWETTDTAWVRYAWGIIRPTPGRNRLDINTHYKGGQVRLRFRDHPSGSWGSWLTATSSPTAFNTFATSTTITAGAAQQVEVELAAASTYTLNVLSVTIAEGTLQSADL